MHRLWRKRDSALRCPRSDVVRVCCPDDGHIRLRALRA